MKIRNIIAALAVIALVPALASAQAWTLGREGKMMQFQEALEAIKEIKAAQKDSLATDKNDKTAKSSTDSLKYGKTYYYIEMAVNNAKAKNDARAAAKNNYSNLLAMELAGVSAEDKAHYNKLVTEKKFFILAEEIKALGSNSSADKNKYYILTEVVKVNGKGLASTGSLKVASTIMSNTDEKSYAYKEAKKVFDRINSSGKAL